MNKKIKALQAKREKLHAPCLEVDEAIRAEWRKLIKASPSVAKAITEVESSTEYGWDSSGEICRFSWPGGLLEPFDTACPDVLREHLGDHCAYLEHGQLQMTEGDAIIINHKGDVFMTGERGAFIRREEYTDVDGNQDEAKRNALIEAHMEKTGYFPGVFRTDVHGNVFHVNTLAREEIAVQS